MIDAHHHLWDLSAREHRWLSGGQTWASDDQLARLRRSFTLDDLAPLAAAAGVSGSVVIQTMAEAWETPDLLALAAGHNPYGGPDPGSPNLLRAVVGWVDLTSPGVAESVAGLRSLRGGGFLRGVRHPVLAEADPGWLARPEVLDGLAELATTGLCFDIVARAHQLPAAVTAARSTAGLTFVLDHLGGPPVARGRESWPPPGRPPSGTWRPSPTWCASCPEPTPLRSRPRTCVPTTRPCWRPSAPSA